MTILHTDTDIDIDLRAGRRAPGPAASDPRPNLERARLHAHWVLVPDHHGVPRPQMRWFALPSTAA